MGWNKSQDHSEFLVQAGAFLIAVRTLLPPMPFQGSHSKWSNPTMEGLVRVEASSLYPTCDLTHPKIFYFSVLIGEAKDRHPVLRQEFKR